MWHYGRDGAPVGPVSHPDLCALFADKELTLETPVWHEGLADWVTASTVDDFRGIWGKGFVRPAAPPVLPPSLSEGSPPRPAAGAPPAARPGMEMRTGRRAGEEWQEQVEPPRPWIRYWARALDLHLLFTAAAFVYVPDTIWGLLGLYFGTFLAGTLIVFPVQLMLFGQTIGKLVFGMHVATENDEPLTLGQAVAREWRVLLKGLALNLPLLPIITLIVAYCRLTRHGATSWDRAGRLVVRHRDVGPLRWLAFLSVWIACYVVAAPQSRKLNANMEQIARSLQDNPFRAPFGPSTSMGSIAITKTAPEPSTQPAVPKKLRPKPKLLTLPSDKATDKPMIRSNSPTMRPVRRPDRPAPGVVFKPDPGPEAK